MSRRTRSRFSRPTTRLRCSRRTLPVAAAALVLGALLPPTTAGAAAVAAAGSAPAGAPQTATAPSWARETLPFAKGTPTGAVRMSGGRIWASAFTTAYDGKALVLRPVLAERDPRTGAWSPVPGAAEAAGEVKSRANAIDAAGKDGAWLVGDESEALGGRIFTQRLHRGSWSVVPADLPEKGFAGSLLSVDALPGGTAWAVGYAEIEVSRTWNPDKGGWILETRHAGIARYFDGSRWRSAELPDPGGEFWTLNAVHAAAADDVWAAGHDGTTGTPLLLHYDGSGWLRVEVPGVTDRPGDVSDLQPSGGSLWLTGRDWSRPDGETAPLVARYAGGRWARTAAPVAKGSLTGAAASRDGGVTVVGESGGTAAAWTSTRDGWTRLPLPALDGPEPSPTTAVSSEHGLTVLGTTPGPDDLPHPFALTRAPQALR